MTNAEERRKTLEMLAEGKISASEAAEILAGQPKTEVEGSPSWLHINVNDLKSGRRKVAVNIPLHLLKVGALFGRSFVPELKGIDWAPLMASLTQGEGGVLVDVEDEVDGQHVLIYVD